MGSLGIKLVGRARPLDYLALMKGILHARGIKLPKDVDASAIDTKVCQPYILHSGALRKHDASVNPLSTVVKAHCWYFCLPCIHKAWTS